MHCHPHCFDCDLFSCPCKLEHRIVSEGTEVSVSSHTHIVLTVVYPVTLGALKVCLLMRHRTLCTLPGLVFTMTLYTVYFSSFDTI